MATPDIDVIMPIFNGAETLDISLESIATQFERNFRVIAIDDGSTDDSPAILSAWAAKDDRFTVITKKNGGIVAALNTGLDAATAPFIARMDSDDISIPTRFGSQRRYLEENGDCVAVGGLICHIDSAGGLIEDLPQPGPPELANPCWAPAREPYIVHPFLMARRETLVAIGGYRNVPHSEDSDLYWRLSDVGRLHNLNETLGLYRIHGGSISGSSLVNGRVMAVGSQLGALSARRRRRGEDDLRFDAGLIPELQRARSLAAMCDHVARKLGGEDAIFRLSVAIKLLELAAYRPYEVDLSDCRFVRRGLSTAGLLDPQNRREIRWYLSLTATRLIRNGRLKEAFVLAPMSIYGRVAVKSTMLFRSEATEAEAARNSP